MVAYSFQGQFVQRIQAKTKSQTIRAHGKRRHVRPGERIQLYTGMRTKACRKIIEPDPVCVAVLPILLDRNGGGYNRILINGEPLSRKGFDEFAREDGFESAKAMADFWMETHGAESKIFEGVLILWGWE